NQWTLLIGCLPLAYSISSGSIDPLPTDSRQVSELLLTSAMGLMAVVLLINLRLSVLEISALAALFVAQFATPAAVVPRTGFATAFLALAAIFATRQFLEMRPHIRAREVPL